MRTSAGARFISTAPKRADYEAGIRSGYLQCQTDHAGMYKYKKALTEGKSKAEAKEYSQRRGK